LIFQRLKPKSDELLSRFVFTFNLRNYGVDERGDNYGHDRSAFVTDTGNAYANETGQRLRKSFALWSVGIIDQKEYTYLDSQVQSLNEMTGRNALPHGILGEFSRCRLWENSQDDTWLYTYQR